MTDAEYLRRAIELGRLGMEAGSGGPFGAVIAREGEILAEANNCVVANSDPTAHAEVEAIRRACAQVGDFRLHDAVIYSSCEPCPMCWSAIRWARIERIVFAAGRDDAAAIGFDDEVLYRELALPPEERQLVADQLLRGEATKMMSAWTALEGRVDY